MPLGKVVKPRMEELGWGKGYPSKTTPNQPPPEGSFMVAGQPAPSHSLPQKEFMSSYLVTGLLGVLSGESGSHGAQRMESWLSGAPPSLCEPDSHRGKGMEPWVSARKNHAGFTSVVLTLLAPHL